MSIHAGFFKRLFSFIVDLTLVIVVTWLLYLFPFNMIISKSIDKDYKNNIKKPNDAISEEYSGKVSYFGTSTEGKFGILSNLYKNEAMSEGEFANYKAVVETGYNTVSSDISNLLINIEKPYSEETAMREQFYSIIYRDYTYYSEINTIFQKYTMDDVFKADYDDETYGKFVQYSILKNTAVITEGQQTDLEKEYNEALSNKNKEILEIFIKALKVYDDKNSDINITSTLAYSTIASAYSSLKGKAADIEAELTADDVEVLSNYLQTFRSYQQTKLNIAANAEGNIPVSEETYYNFYYGLYFEQFDLQLSYYAQVYEHTSWAIIYALAMFTLAFSIYTVVMRGNTLGRRCVKIQLTDGHEREKLNPVLALLHDVPFKFLYIILLGLLSLLAAGIAMVAFTIVDLLMIAFTKQHKTLRDIFSGTRVIEARNY